jgi:hypothetical protein
MVSSRTVMLVSRRPADRDFYTRLLRDYNFLSVPVSAGTTQSGGSPRFESATSCTGPR